MSTAGIFWPRNLCLSVILLLCTKFRVNQTINRRFPIWRPSAILNLQNFDILSCDRPWVQNLRKCTKFHWNRMIPGCDIAIRPLSRCKTVGNNRLALTMVFSTWFTYWHDEWCPTILRMLIAGQNFIVNDFNWSRFSKSFCTACTGTGHPWLC